jgi:glycosyltransferase involved in cell wall biosynthesis
MHVLILEAGLTGHHSGYLERIAVHYIDAGNSITVTVLQRDTRHPAIDRLKRNYGAAFNVVSLDDAKYQATLYSSMGGRELALRHMFGQAYRVVHQDKPVDYVFLPYLDYCLYAFGLLGSPFGSTQWGGICMRPSFHYSSYGVIAPKPKLASVKQALFLKLLRSKTLKSVYTIDELLHRFVAEQHPQWAHRLQYVPDPAELNGSNTYESARQELGIPDEAVVVLVYGAIDGRKGLDVLVEALDSSDLLSTFHLLVVGKQSDSIRSLIGSEQFTTLVGAKRCHVINGFVDDAVQQMVFVASDVVWVGYRNHNTMSGVMVLAGMASKPMISSSNGLLGWYINEMQLGTTFNEHCSEQVIVSLHQMISKENRVVCGLNSHIIFNKNKWDIFIEILKINCS